ncbi:MAG TPA: hypothetical protein VKU82_14295 [Planctomycetaceae bacterium]|nr:hypothetical protein [Planctomycetaceae bacterium]
MKMNRWSTLVLGIGLLLALVVVAVQNSLDAQDKPAPAEPENPFADKIVMIYERNDPSRSAGFVLEQAAITEVKGFRFLVGKCIDRRDDSMAGLKARIPLDSIGSIIEFENLKAYEEYEAKFPDDVEAMPLPLGVPFPPDGAS